MDCPHCKVPLMRGMNICPKCKFDTKTCYGGARHLQWLIDQNENYSEALAAEYPDIISEHKERIRNKEEIIEHERAVMQEKASILISSGFNFDGYKIVKYSGYISGDDAVQLPRSGIFGSDNGKKLTDALVKIRSRALVELKEAAYALGCNAVIGVDFDYITLEPETANLHGGTLYEPYIICVTANGNAVIIEKEDT